MYWPNIQLGNLFLVGTVGFGLAVLAFRRQRLQIIHSLKKEKLKIVGSALLCIFALISLQFLLAYLVNQTGQEQKSINQQLLEQQMSQAGVWAKVLWGIHILIGSPLVEELIFRWLIFEVCGKSYFSLGLSALTFAFAHHQGEKGLAITLLLPYFSMGLIFAYVYKKKGNILWPFAFHFFANLIAFIFMLFQTR